MPVNNFKNAFLAASTALLCGAASVHAQDANLSSTEVLVKVGKGVQTAQTSTLAQRVQGVRFLKTYPTVGWAKMQIPAGQKVTPELLAQLSKSLGTQVVGNYIRRAQKNPNDTEYTNQWGLPQISAPRAWDVTTGTSSAVVAVIDSGVNYSHVDLATNMWKNPGESGGGKETNGTDDDGNGYIDDVYGINAAATGAARGNPSDAFGHGTRVAGVIGAVGNNGQGVVGVNWTTKLMALRFMDSGGSGSDADAIECIDYIIAQKKKGVNIRAVNCSWGGEEDNPALEEAFEDLTAEGILAVCSSGNSGNNNDSTVKDFPSSYTNAGIISVGASTSSDNLAGFSNYGATSVDLTAPGVDILSTANGGGYSPDTGTSMAAPFVSGAVALIAAKNPNSVAANVKKRILESVDKFPQLTGTCVTGGRLNLNRAVRNAIYSISGETFRIDSKGDKIPLSGVRIILNGTTYTNTDEDGKYAIENLPPAFYSIEAKRPGFTFPTKVTTLPQPAQNIAAPNAIRNFQGTMSAPKYYTVSGTALNNAGNPAAGIKIYWNALTAPVAITGADGKYVIKQRIAETFSLKAEGGGLEWTPSVASQTLPTTGLATSPNGLVNFTGKLPDTTPPVVTITTPANNATLTTASSSATGTARDVTGVAQMKFTLYRVGTNGTEFYDWVTRRWTTSSTGDGVILTVNANNSTFYNWKITFPVLANGDYTLIAWGRDTKGNESDGSFDAVSSFKVKAGTA